VAGHWKRFTRKVSIILFCLSLCALAVVSSYIDSKGDRLHEIRSDHNISDVLEHPFSSAVRSSRLSSVSVMSMSIEGGYVSSSSGTYIVRDEKYYVLTVSHGISTQDCDFIRIVVDEDIYNCTEISVYDETVDYAILEVHPIPDRMAVDVLLHVPPANKWIENLSIGARTVYTGYPSGMGPLTIEGSIAGYTESDNIYLHSFAWPGSSGSGVFNDRHNLIGFIMAINLGYTEFGITVLEDIVIVVPLHKIDWDTLE
jgi:hypothetical protein